MKIKVEYYTLDNVWIAENEYKLYGYGENKKEAIEDLNQATIELYEDLLKEEKLGFELLSIKGKITKDLDVIKLYRNRS
jgi:hypothetical protein